MKTSVLKFCIVIFVFFNLSNSYVFAQKEVQTFTAKNAIYLDLGGNAGQYAFSYGRLFHEKGLLKVIGSAGFALWADRVQGKTVFNPAVPLEVSGLIGKRDHHLELGFGVTPHLATSLNFNSETSELEDKVVFESLLPFRIGYRYQKPKGGFFFRIGYTPFFNVPVGGREDWSFEPRFAGISFGKSF
ncbi:hypothetical protein [Algoriphagus taiwanensis]|uniref:Outer membrane protein beta-barrel domain-containing protein n=2 Tax=Algoriphagus taiwanensis TaxID=1445656 RepID=A0ABQ6Q060_9BACT|nr:hypothetical protein Ataiwa_12270 [Algoriphagus taiwanensis]